jgi:hypothetical protein
MSGGMMLKVNFSKLGDALAVNSAGSPMVVVAIPSRNIEPQTIAESINAVVITARIPSESGLSKLEIAVGNKFPEKVKNTNLGLEKLPIAFDARVAAPSLNELLRREKKSGGGNVSSVSSALGKGVEQSHNFKIFYDPREVTAVAEELEIGAREFLRKGRIETEFTLKNNELFRRLAKLILRNGLDTESGKKFLREKIAKDLSLIKEQIVNDVDNSFEWRSLMSIRLNKTRVVPGGSHEFVKTTLGWIKERFGQDVAPEKIKFSRNLDGRGHNTTSFGIIVYRLIPAETTLSYLHLYHELLHLTQGGFDMQWLDEAMTEKLTEQLLEDVGESRIGEHKSFYFEGAQESLERIADIIGWSPFFISYITGDECFLVEALGKNGRLAFQLLESLSDFRGLEKQILNSVLGNLYSRERLFQIEKLLISYREQLEESTDNESVLMEKTGSMLAEFIPKKPIGPKREYYLSPSIYEKLKSLAADQSNPTLNKAAKEMFQVSHVVSSLVEPGGAADEAASSTIKSLYWQGTYQEALREMRSNPMVSDFAPFSQRLQAEDVARLLDIVGVTNEDTILDVGPYNQYYIAGFAALKAGRVIAVDPMFKALKSYSNFDFEREASLFMSIIGKCLSMPAKFLGRLFVEPVPLENCNLQQIKPVKVIFMLNVLDQVAISGSVQAICESIMEVVKEGSSIVFTTEDDGADVLFETAKKRGYSLVERESYEYLGYGVKRFEVIKAGVRAENSEFGSVLKAKDGQASSALENKIEPSPLLRVNMGMFPFDDGNIGVIGQNFADRAYGGYLDSDTVIAEIREIAARDGLDALRSGTIQKTNKRLYGRGLSQSGGWGDAVIMAGFEYIDGRPGVSISKDEVLDRIRKIASEKGVEELKPEYVQETDEGFKLYSAAMLYFGTWGKAVAAVFDYDQIKKRIEKDVQDASEETGSSSRRVKVDLFSKYPLLSSYQPQDLKSTLQWLNLHREELGGCSFKQLIRVFIEKGGLPEGENAQTWERGASAFVFYLNNRLLQTYQPKDLRTTLYWLEQHRFDLGGNSLKYLVDALSIAGKLPKDVSEETWKFAAGAYDFYLKSNLLKEYQPKEIRRTLNWLYEHRDELGNNSLSYLVFCFSVAGKIPEENERRWGTEAGSFARAIQEKKVILREIKRIWQSGEGWVGFINDISRLRALFNPKLLLNLRTGKPVSYGYRIRILSYAYDLYGKEYIRKIKNKGDGFKFSGSSPVDDSVNSASSGVEKKGGIDFRALPIVTQAVSSLGLNTMSYDLRFKLSQLDVNAELAAINKLLSAGITPSTDRLKACAQAAYLFSQSPEENAKILSCIAQLLRKEESECCDTESVLKDILIVLEAG